MSHSTQYAVLLCPCVVYLIKTGLALAFISGSAHRGISSFLRKVVQSREIPGTFASKHTL